jgi:hypothetical protein
MQIKTMTSLDCQGAAGNNRGKDTKLDLIFEGFRKERLRQTEMKQVKLKKLKKWWETTGDLLGLEENPFWSTQSTSSLETRKAALFQNLRVLNVCNKNMIATYCQKQERKTRRRTRSLSFKAKEEEGRSTEAEQQCRTKINSLKEIDSPTKKVAFKNRRVVDAKSKMVAPIFG